jgi:hypothetical protein
VKLVLAVVDGMKPAMVRRAVETGQAPVLAKVIERGAFVSECVAAFPSVTPVCATTIATGARQDAHHIPAMNWFWRDERRYVEYGSSMRAARRFGIAQQLTDLVYTMNAEHLSEGAPTIFEVLDDAGVRTAGTTFLIYRGRHEHQVSKATALTRLAGMAFRRPVMGPGELFYADIFASQDTGCRSALGKPGLRDQHAGCVGNYLFEHDLCDFLLLSLPDNDTHSHRFGPDAQVASIAAADRQIERMAHAAGGIDAFLDTHALIVVADHSHALIERRIGFEAAFRDFHVLGPSAAGFDEAEIALCPSARSAQIYVLVPEGREALVPRLVTEALALDGIEHVLHRAGDEGVLRSADGGELRFAPGGDARDARGGTWALAGDLGVLNARVEDGLLITPDHPDALGRCWAALQCPTSGDVLLSAAPGYEFPDWGGVDHVGGGSHGSLHHSDSLGALLFCGIEAPARQAWGIQDVAPLCASAFGVPWPAS